MLVGQRFGPFAIDKELGSGAMGAVYRGRYVQTGQLMAIKVMAPGLGSTNANAAARFDREAAILKQFNHPNIVRLYGVGKSHGTRYYAMEYIEGESLDRVMARRDRMTWEEVVALGRPLCAALEHAHQQGVIHRDLKPSNLMILKDGTLKLTDFGIAKDMDVTQLTSQNCTVGTAAYMSPEQCRGERDLTHKSDLYSLGIVLYELITGSKPFEAENAMDMFMQHVQGEFTRPGRLVLDMPVWLDTLICQLMEKKPEHRPLNAATVYAALGSIQEKVEAQRSAGVEAAKTRMADRPRGAPKADNADREMARTLLTGKGRGKRRRKREYFYQRGWFVIVGLLGLFLVLGVLLWVALRPPSAEGLFAKSQALAESKNADDRDAALDGPIKLYLLHYADRPGEQTAKVKAWADQIEVEQFDRKLQSYLAKKRRSLPYPAQDEKEEIAWKAADREDEGNVAEATARWRELREKAGPLGWGRVADVHIAELATLDGRDADWQEHLQRIRINGREPDLQGPEKEAFTAYRAEHLGDRYAKPGDQADLLQADRRWKELKERSAQEPGQRFWYLLAARKVHALKGRLPETKEPDKLRRELIQKALEEATAFQKTDPLIARAICLDLIALYADAADLKPLLDEAREIERAANASLRGTAP